MDSKELHDFLFKLYDFTESAMKLESAQTVDPKAGDMIAAYIEDFMDVYGRNIIVEMARDTGMDSSESLRNAHEKIDELRLKLRVFNDSPELNSMMDEAVNRLKRSYGTK